MDKIDTDIWGYLLRNCCQMENPETAKTILNADNPVCCPQELDINSLVLKMPDILMWDPPFYAMNRFYYCWLIKKLLWSMAG